MPFKTNNPGCPCGCASGNTVILFGCPCAVPLTLTMTVTNSSANFHIFHDATLQWQTTPGGLAGLGGGANAMLSTATFTDDSSTNPFRYFFFCASAYFCLARVYEQSPYGSPYLEQIRYRWLAGASGNTCSPFSLTNGIIFTGGDSATTIAITG